MIDWCVVIDRIVEVLFVLLGDYVDGFDNR
jgi:hypothetical protein